MINEKTYFLMAFLSYCDFESSEEGRSLWDIFSKELHKKWSDSNFVLLSQRARSFFLDFFEEELKAWTLLATKNCRASSLNPKQSGFFACCFQREEDYILAFRGSEVYPFEDAYLDFVNTDLVIGLGKAPRQFEEAVDFYEALVQKGDIPKENLALTGHSLGGGIAQYVAFYSYRKRNYVPNCQTWNAVGVHKKGILLEEEEEELLPIEEKKEEKAETASWNQEVLQRLTSLQVKYQRLREGEVSLQKIQENESIQRRIRNYGHSADLTFSLFPHIGTEIFIDRFGNPSKEGFLDKMQRMRKSIVNYHREDVFLPFFSEKGDLEEELSLEYMASLLRSLIREERFFSKEFLAAYYNKEEDFDGRQELRALLKKYPKLLYQKIFRKQVARMDAEEWKKLWKECQRRMANPYAYEDLLDFYVFEEV